MGFITEEILIMKMDLIMLANHFKEKRFQTCKSLLKENSANIRLWLNFYQWCLYFEKYDEADKIINVLLSNERNIKNHNLFSLFYSYLIRHYMFSILFLNNSKYSLESLSALIDTITVKLHLTLGNYIKRL